MHRQISFMQGAGGFGSMYTARWRDKDVAVKRLSPSLGQDSEQYKALVREVEASAASGLCVCMEEPASMSDFPCADDDSSPRTSLLGLLLVNSLRQRLNLVPSHCLCGALALLTSSLHERHTLTRQDKANVCLIMITDLRNL